MSRIPWVFTDPVTSDVYVLPVNPNSDGGSFGVEKTIAYSAVAGCSQFSNRNILIYTTGIGMGSFSYSGNLYTAEHLLAFEDWFSRDYPFEIEDDLGRRILAVVESFDLKRARTRHHLWKHSYTFSGSVLEEL